VSDDREVLSVDLSGQHVADHGLLIASPGFLVLDSCLLLHSVEEAQYLVDVDDVEALLNVHRFISEPVTELGHELLVDPIKARETTDRVRDYA